MVLWVARKEAISPPASRRKNPVRNEKPLVERRPGYNPGMRKFMRAVKYGRVEDAKWAIKNEEINPDGRGKYGDTALIVAASYEHTMLASALLEMGVDPNARGNYLITALMVAVKNSRGPEMMEILMDFEARVRARNLFLGTVLDELRWSTLPQRYPHIQKQVERKWVEEGAFYKVKRKFFSEKNAEA